MLGGVPGDEDFSPGDDDFDPREFHFPGFGQPGQGPPSHPLDDDAVAPANPEILEAVGWNAWPNANAAQANGDDEPPNLVPFGPAPNALGPEENIEPVEEIVQAENDNVLEPPVPQVAKHVLAMDDLTHESEEEPQMPPLIDDLEVEMPAFPNLQNHQPVIVEEVPLEDLIPFEDLAPQQPLPPY